MSKLPLTHLEILTFLADYRILSVVELETLLNKSPQMIRRWLRKLSESEHIEKSPPINTSRGRPSKYFQITQKGFEVINEDRHLKFTPLAPTLLNHQHILNQFNFWLDAQRSDISYNFTSATSLFHRPYRLKTPLIPNSAYIIPDAVMVASRDDKHLLHFVEIDLDTESLVSKKHYLQSIAHKLDSYRVYRTHMKNDDLGFGDSFNGFRVLFVTHSSSRWESLCSFVQRERWSDFFWIADMSMLTDSPASWAKGGEMKQLLPLF